MTTFISNIKASDGATQHATGFQKAFQLLRNTSSLSKQSASKEMLNSGWLCHRPGGADGERCLPATDMVIIYLSSGVTSREASEQEKRATLSVVREENRHLNNSVMILTYALMNGTPPPKISVCPQTLAAFNEWLNLNIKMILISAAALPFLCVWKIRLWVREVL